MDPEDKSKLIKFLIRIGINTSAVLTIGGRLLGLGAALNSENAGGYQDPNKIEGYTYNEADGRWYGYPPSPDTGVFGWFDPASPSKQIELNQYRYWRELNNRIERAAPLDGEAGDLSSPSLFELLVILPDVVNRYREIGPDLWREFWDYILDPIFGPDGVVANIKAALDNAATIPSPIVLDLDGDGIETLSIYDGSMFDHSADGFSERTGWISADDGFLVRDLDGDGAITSGRELFGSETILSRGVRAPNGFIALRELDSNLDGKIDSEDSYYEKLQIWRDLNLNGISEDGELSYLADAGVGSIEVGYVETTYVDPQGNEHRQVGSYKSIDGQDRVASDIWFKTNPSIGLYDDRQVVPAGIAQLPNIRGAGKVLRLHDAMTADSTGELKSLVESFIAATTQEDRDALVTEIIFRWTGVQDIDPSSRSSRIVYGNAIGDARKLEALEEFTGQEWFGVWCWGARDPNPHGRAAPVLLAAFDNLKALIYGQLASQTFLKPLFSEITWEWDDEAGSLNGDVSGVAAILRGNLESNRQSGLDQLSDFLHSIRGMGLVNSIDTVQLKNALVAIGSDVAQVIETALSGLVIGGATSGNDVLRGTEFDDATDGLNGNDRLIGRGGDDLLIGGGGNDILDGGVGDDELRGGTGNDTYIFGKGSGHDILIDFAEGQGHQHDRVQFVGLNPSDVSVSLDSDKALVFTIVDSGETLKVLTDGGAALLSGVGEYLFEDGSIWGHDDVLRLTVAISTDYDDLIQGSFAGDVIVGQLGSDILRGNEGNDVVRGGAGDDILTGDGGDDVLDGGYGNDLLIGSTSREWIFENGIWLQRDSLTPVSSPNGNDVYLFGRGDGQDTVIDSDYTAGNIDTLRFKEGVALADVDVSRVGYDLILAIRDSEDRVTLKNYFNDALNDFSSQYLIERVAFSDGTVLTALDLQQIRFAGSNRADSILGSRSSDILTGQDGNDILIGGFGSDTLIGGQGDDVLLGGDGRDVFDGGAGNDILRGGGGIDFGGRLYDASGEGDTYLFGRGDGNDTIIENGWSGSGVDRVEFKSGLAPEDVRLERIRTVVGWQVTDDLRITIRDTGETLTVTGHFNGRSAIEEIVFPNGSIWGVQEINSATLIGEDLADELRGFESRNDSISGGGGNDKLIGMSGDDTLSGGAGNDELDGGSGSDRYLLGLGDGVDLLQEHAASGTDVIELAPGIIPSEVTVRWTLQGDMALTLVDGTMINVRGQASSWSSEIGIEQVKFADGTVWSRSDLAERALVGTSSDDVIVGGELDDTIDAGVGNDRLQNLGGYDTYRFGSGDGTDVIDPTRGRLVFKPGVGPNDVGFSRAGNDLLATLVGSGDSVRAKNWFTSWIRIDRFDFANGASLSVGDVLAQLNLGEDEEILNGSPGDDQLEGTGKDSTLYGGDGNDVLSGGAGSDVLWGESGDDILDGGADRDFLRGGEGNNSYQVSAGMGLDYVTSLSLSVANDTVVFAAGITADDVTVQLGDLSYSTEPGAVGYYNLVIGIGGDDALIVGSSTFDVDLGQNALQRFRFADGTEWTLGELIARADDGKYGSLQRNSGDSTDIVASQADDSIYDDTGESLTVRARGNDDSIFVLGGDDVISAGTGTDYVFSGGGEDVVAGESGNDTLYTDAGDDVIAFNYGDGDDLVLGGDGSDVLSFGASVTPQMISLAFNADRKLVVLVDGGAGGSVTLEASSLDFLAGDLERLQFVDAAGSARVFDLTGWLRSRVTTLVSATLENPLSFDGGGFELTSTVAPSGGLQTIAYAQSGDLFGTAIVAGSTPSDGDDKLYGTSDADVLNGGAGNDTVLGLAGADLISGGDGSDLISGGAGDDVLEGDAGNDIIYGGQGADQLSGGTGIDQLFGELGGDTYVFERGHGEVTIDDDHRVVNLAYGGEAGYGGEVGYGGVYIDDAPNILSFGEGIRPEDLRYLVRNGDLVIEFISSPGDRVILRGHEPDRATQTRSVDIIRFADGFEIAADEIIPSGVSATAGDGGGALSGTQFADTLIGGDGDDFINGQAGPDRLVGGVGSDVYRIYKEIGTAPTEVLIAEIWRLQDSNRVEIEGYISEFDLRLEFDGRDLLLRYTQEGDVIRFVGFDPRLEGMQSPVTEISLPWSYVTLTFDQLLAQGIHIIGTPNEDVLTGTALADWIEGRESNDTMSGGAGGDTYIVDFEGGIDTIIDIESGDVPNTLVLPWDATVEDIRLSFDQEGFLIISIDSTGNRVRLSGFDPQDPLGSRAVERFRFGIDGDEISYEELLSRGFDIVGTDGGDSLTGTALSDRVSGGAGSDLIVATPGGDWLAGGTGNDTYVVNLNSGVVNIDDLAQEGAGNVLRFGPGIDPNVIRNQLRFEPVAGGGQVLLISYGGPGDVIRLTGFNPQDVLGTRAVDRFEFADGTVVDYATLVSWTFAVEGDDSANILDGSNGDDRLFGLAGEDSLNGGAGSDELKGGAGNDLLIGSDGDDGYVFEKGDGVDTVVDSGAADFNYIRFGVDIRPSDVRREWEGNTLVLHYTDNDSVRIENFYGVDGKPAILALAFEDGTVVSLTEQLNQAPFVTQTLDDVTVTEDQDFSLALSPDLFSDPDAADTVQVSARLASGDPLPAWLKFDAASRTFSGRPGNGDVANISVLVEGQDQFGATASTTFTVSIQNVNDAPEVGALLSDVRVSEGDPFSYTLPAAAFTDVDVGDELTYTVVMEDGSAIPSWLTFDAVTRTLFGTPTDGDVGDLRLSVVATDQSGASVSQSFNLTVANSNDAPEAGSPLVNQQATEDAAFQYAIPAGSFTDTDEGDRLFYTATLSNGSPLPSWLQLDEATGVFTGTPLNEDVGILELLVTATDLSGASASQTFSLTVANTNDAPTSGVPLAPVNLSEDAQFSYSIPANAFSDVDAGDNLRYTAMLANGAALPAWLSLNPISGVFSGTPGNADVGTLDLLVTATDQAGASTGQALRISVANVNDAPVVSVLLQDQQAEQNQAFAFTVPANSFQDVDAGDVLAFTAGLSNGSPLPSWLSFDPTTRRFSGTPWTADVGTLAVRVTATDRAGVSASDDFTITVGGGTPSEPGMTLIGDWRDNQLIGGSGDDVAQGNGGSDYINLFGGNNVAHGSWGNDTILAGSGNDTVYGNGGHDTISVGDGQNRVYSGWGDDVITTGSGDDVIEAGEGLNRISSGAGNDQITTLSGNDWIDAGSGNNTISAGEGQNTVVAGAGNDVITTASGNDIIHAGDGNNTITAGEGQNQIFTGAGADVIRAQGVNQIQAGSGNDDITLAWGADLVDAGAGNDTIRAGGGGDIVRGGAGDDVILSQQWSSDTYIFGMQDGRDLISDDGGFDVLQLEGINADQLWFERTEGDLRINVVGASDGVTVQGWFTKSFGKIEQIRTADGQTLSAEQVEARIASQSSAARMSTTTSAEESEPAGQQAQAQRSMTSSEPAAMDSAAYDSSQNRESGDQFLDEFLENYDQGAAYDATALPPLDSRWFEQWTAKQATQDQSGSSEAAVSVERHWAELTLALNRLDAERQDSPAWSQYNQGADISALGDWTRSDGHAARSGVDTVSLASGSGTLLKGFTGIQEGVAKLSM